MDAPSTTPLYKKLGLKSEFIVQLINAPEYFMALIEDRPDHILFINKEQLKKDMIVFFVQRHIDMLIEIKGLQNDIKQNGMIWIAWPKIKSKLPREINENQIRDTALEHGLVDVKVCSIDDHWSALKLVIPIKSRISPKV